MLELPAHLRPADHVEVDDCDAGPQIAAKSRLAASRRPTESSSAVAGQIAVLGVVFVALAGVVDASSYAAFPAGARRRLRGSALAGRRLGQVSGMRYLGLAALAAAGGHALSA